MLSGVGLILASLRYNIINTFLHCNIKIGKKLTYILAKYEADEYAIKNEKIDLRNIPNRIKNIMLHDQDIIDRRFSMCQDCEHFISMTSQCSVCKCFMRVKTKMATASCPLSPPKWEKEYDFIKGKKVGLTTT